MQRNNAFKNRNETDPDNYHRYILLLIATHPHPTILLLGTGILTRKELFCRNENHPSKTLTSQLPKELLNLHKIYTKVLYLIHTKVLSYRGSTCNIFVFLNPSSSLN